jgi:hypothetical protein
VISSPGPDRIYSQTRNKKQRNRSTGDDIQLKNEIIYNITNFRNNNRKQEEIKFNAAVNYWFTPLFQKEFPCATCRKYINLGEYNEILSSLYSLYMEPL